MFVYCTRKTVDDTINDYVLFFCINNYCCARVDKYANFGKKKNKCRQGVCATTHRKILYRVKWQMVMQWLCIRHVHTVITTLYYDTGKL